MMHGPINIRFTNGVLIAFNGYVSDLNKLQQFKVSVQKSHHLFNALFNPLANSTCSSLEVVLAAFLLYEGSTVHNASDQFVSCVSLLILRRIRFSSIPTDKNLICTRHLQTAVSSHPLKGGHMFI